MRNLISTLLLLCVSFLTTQDQPEQVSKRTYRLIRFSAIWCAPCQQQARIFNDGGIYATMQQLGVQSAYYDMDIPSHKALADKFRVQGIPATFLVEVLPDGKWLITKRWTYGLMTADQFRQFVDPGKSGPEPPQPLQFPAPRR